MTLPFTTLVSNIDIHTSTLTLEQVTPEYIGEYTCTAENEGGKMSDVINVYGMEMMHVSTCNQAFCPRAPNVYDMLFFMIILI